MDADALREEIRRLGPWHHVVEVAPGVTTAADGPQGEGDTSMPAVYSAEDMIRHIVKNVYPAGLENRSFLDCACNAGGHVLAARKFGAGRCFGFDARQHWIDQARFLARHLPSEDMRFDAFELAELPAKRLEPFDVTLFSGIFYHLPDPVAGLRIAADQTRELLIVNTSVLPRADKALVLSPESASHVMSGIHGLAWLPTGPEVVRDILRWCGFPHSRVDIGWRPFRASRWYRVQILAARDEATFAHYDLVKPNHGAPGLPARWRRALRRLLDRLDV